MRLRGGGGCPLPEVIFDTLDAALAHATRRALSTAVAAEARASRVREVVQAVNAADLADAIAAITVEARHLDDLAGILEFAVTAAQEAGEAVTALTGSVDELAEALDKLADVEGEAGAAIEAWRGLTDEIQEAWAAKLADLGGELEAPLHALSAAARASVQATDELRVDTIAVAEHVTEGLTAFGGDFERAAAATLGQGWDQLTAGLQAELAEAGSGSADAFSRSGQATERNVLGAAESTLGTVGESAEQVRRVLERVNQLIGTARDLQAALCMASGGL